MTMALENSLSQTEVLKSRPDRLYFGYDDTWLEEQNRVDGVELPPMTRNGGIDESVQELELYWRIPAVREGGYTSERCAKCLSWDRRIRRTRCVVYFESYIRNDPFTWLDDDDYLILGKLEVFEEVIFRVVDVQASLSSSADIMEVKGVPLDGTEKEKRSWKVMKVRRELSLLQAVQRGIQVFLPECEVVADGEGHLLRFSVENGDYWKEEKWRYDKMKFNVEWSDTIKNMVKDGKAGGTYAVGGVATP